MGRGAGSVRERHGLERRGQRGLRAPRESVDATGAVVMGRRMFSGGEGPWDTDPNDEGWWGDDPPFRAPVFIMTSHARGTVAKEGGTSYTFVTDGVESAVRQARDAAGEKNVGVAGGANVVRRAFKAVRVDELRLHLAPILHGSGTRLLDDLGDVLERTAVIESPGVTHLTFRVVN